MKVEKKKKSVLANVGWGFSIEKRRRKNLIRQFVNKPDYSYYKIIPEKKQGIKLFKLLFE